MVTNKQTHQPLILFDGVCNLCSRFVRFVINRERQAQFRFSSLQSEVGRALINQSDLSSLGSIVLIENGRYYRKSAAVLRIALKLNNLWPASSCFLIIPRPLRDLFYDYIGNRRYRWFGITETCWLPTGETGNRFVDNLSDLSEFEFEKLSQENRAVGSCKQDPKIR